ncbi:UDPGT domain-containing protein [Cephalotus follicularis]|uniref:UDPGT domain-containing protein n=1 Tax=Cephalotus follicularis TaxID=3775 RepID=A0A1Q3AMI6_CEPFO|nr:UDPGT domain-containing protein [Cephalotus follicularis]
MLHHAKRYKLAEGIMVNSFPELEAGAIKALQEKEPGKPPVYPIGPLVKMGSSGNTDDSDCLKWLDNQPHSSVLFVSFGSGGTLSSDQISELALGLEMSEQRFLWVVRSPNDKVANATFFSVESGHRDPSDFLPKGFLERTKGRGMVVPSWAPQAQVLSHGSTGGFLTHCGWNSTLESVVNGVPLIAWPLYAEQKMNAVMLTEDIKVALRPNASESGLIGRVEITRVVKALMEGEEGKMVRYRMKDLKDAATKVLSEDGSSTKALSELAHKWSRNQKSC